MYVCTYVITNLFVRAECDTWSIFNRFEFSVFLLLDWLPNQGLRTQSTLLFSHSWRENNWSHTFPEDINVM